ncbi:MAG TPA: hypothetical protein VEU07_13145, partial [Candidatus Acidoferrum sp.]|nr:hypothetical protein [Candidatus Acidoferrum sp.]
METLDPTLGPSPNATTADTGDVASDSPAPMEVPEADSRSTRTPRHYARRVFMPEDLLEAARGGMSLREIAYILGTRIGRTVSRATV